MTDAQERTDVLRQMPYLQYLETQHWKSVRLKALRRSHGELCGEAGTTLGYWRCEKCHCSIWKSQDVHVHHKTYQNVGREEPGDLVTLCVECHTHHHVDDIWDKMLPRARKAVGYGS